MAGDPSLRGLTGALETGLAGVKRGEIKLDSTATPFSLIAQTVEDVLNKGAATFSWRELANNKPLADADRRSFIEFRPILDFNALEPGKDATDAIRQAAKDLNLAGEYGARVRLTGPVPTANEEFATVQDGAVVNSIGTVLVVLLILWMALHSSKIIFAVFVTLFIGLATTTAAGLMMVGSLNLLSIAFAVLFIGLGVDFGIQYSVRYRSERFKNNDLEAALVHAAERSAVPLSLAAMATAAGFLSFLPTDYKGISELGKIAGVGMLVAFMASITVLPALLKMLNPPGEKEPVGYAFLAPVDHFLEKHRVAIIVGTLLVAVAGMPALYFLKFDFNPIHLRNAKVESIATYLDLRKDPNTGASAVNVMGKSVDEARKIEARLAKVPEVLRTRSLDSFVPPDQPAKLKSIAQGAQVLNPALNPDQIDAPPTDQENIDALKGAADSLRKTAGNAKGPGADASRRLADDLTRLADSNEATRNKAQAVFVDPLKIMIEQLKLLLQAQPVSLKTLPPDLVRSWQTKEGITRVEALPRGDPDDNEIAAKVRLRGSRRRANCDRRAGVDSQIRRNRREGLHPCRLLGAAFHQPVALAGVAADHRRAADAGAAAGGGRGDAGNLRADRTAAQLRQHRSIAAAARRRRRVQDLLRHRMAVRQDEPAAVEPDARDIFQRDDDGDRVRQPVAVEPSGHREHGQASGIVAGHHARRGAAVSAGANGQTARCQGGDKYRRRHHLRPRRGLLAGNSCFRTGRSGRLGCGRRRSGFRLSRLTRQTGGLDSTGLRRSLGHAVGRAAWNRRCYAGPGLAAAQKAQYAALNLELV